MDGLLKREKDRGEGLEVGVVWRRSFVDEAKGERWEKVLSFLGGLALRTLVDGMKGSLLGDFDARFVQRNKLTRDSDCKVPKNLSPEQAVEGAKLAAALYRAEAAAASALVEERGTKLALLRARGLELLQTKVRVVGPLSKLRNLTPHSQAQLASDSFVKREHADLDMKHLVALRDERVQQLSPAVWSLLATGDPRTHHSSPSASLPSDTATKVVNTSPAEEPC